MRTKVRISHKAWRLRIGLEGGEGMESKKTQPVYIAIDLKSFFASVECVERGLDPLTAHLVVADPRRTEKTICLAVSPALKAYGIPGRPRLFEVVQRVREVNAQRRYRAPGQTLTGACRDARELAAHPEMALDYWVAPPRMSKYMEYSMRAYQVYLRYIAPEDIHIYSIDEVFIEATRYLPVYGLTARALAVKMIREVLRETGVTATAGIGTNLYLCKIAMDIEAKRAAPDADGVRIAELDEKSYRERLWEHRPLTDFWRVGPGYARKLEAHHMYTMGDVALKSTYDPELLFRLFGVNAELLIDHAWGFENCTLADIKAYRPSASSLGTGQVLQSPYSFAAARIILREMGDSLAQALVGKGLVTQQLTLTVGYDVESLKTPAARAAYQGAVVQDHYGRALPKAAHGTQRLPRATASARMITQGLLAIYDRTVQPGLLIRRVNVEACNIAREEEARTEGAAVQLDLFSDAVAQARRRQREDAALAREKRLQEARLGIAQRFGKNALFRGTSLQAEATGRERNGQIGGHKA